MAAHSFQETTGLAILAVVVLVQLVIFPLIEIVIFPRSKDIQKLYLEKNYGIREAFDTSKLILFNLGFYNVLCGLVVVYAVRVECVDLLYALMWVFIGNGLVGLYQSLQYYFASLARAIPATLALSYIKFLPVADVKKMSMPWLIVLIPVLLHMSFFVLESLLFPRSKPVQMLFIGKAATSPVAVDAGSFLGIYN